MSRWFRERVLLRLDVPAAPGDAPLADRARQGALQRALGALQAQLEVRALPRRARVTCIVSGELVRYRVLPWNPSARTAVQRQRFAQHCFEDAYGECARGWTVRADAPRYESPTLACAVDTSLLDGVAATVARHGLVLRSVQPSLMNAYRRAAPDRSHARFAVAEVTPSLLTLLLMDGSVPLSVKQVPAPRVDLKRTIEREWLSLGLDAGECPVFVDVGPDASDCAEHCGAGWVTLQLGSWPPLSLARVSLAPTLEGQIA